MKFYNRGEIATYILENKDRHRLINIIAPAFSGKSQLIKEVKEKIEELPKTLVIEQRVDGSINFECIKTLCNLLKVEFDINVKYPPENISLCDSLVVILNQIHTDYLNHLYFFVDDIDKNGLKFLYDLLSQLRSLREKLTSGNLDIGVSLICFGKWNPSELRKECDSRVGSFFPEEIFLNDYDSEEVKILTKQYLKRNDFVELNEYKLKYLWEITGGCYGILAYVLKNIGNEFSCNKIRVNAYNFSKEKFFIEYLENSTGNLSRPSKDAIITLLDKRIIKYTDNEKSEELLLSGIVKRSSLYGRKILVLRSWIHEISLRNDKRLSHSLGYESIFRNINELIPPTPSINKAAYEIVLEIENRIRDIVVIVLSKNNPTSSPFRVADKLGKRDEKWKKETLYEELKHQRNKVKELYSDFADAHSSLSSFLSVKELVDIVLDNENKSGLNNYFKDIFPRTEENVELFRRFRIIRNQIAHNNIITEKTVEELYKISRRLTEALTGR